MRVTEALPVPGGDLTLLVLDGEWPDVRFSKVAVGGTRYDFSVPMYSGAHADRRNDSIAIRGHGDFVGKEVRFE